MAYYQFDLTFINLEDLPPGSFAISVQLKIGVAGIGPNKNAAYDDLPTSGDYSLSYSTAGPPSGDPFQLDATDQMWIVAEIYSEYTGPDTDQLLVHHALGPYSAGDIGTVVAAP
jgi:hypothetical protein